MFSPGCREVTAPVLVDAHCHLDECGDPIAAANAARRVGAVIIAMTSTPAAYQPAASRFAGMAHVRVALGLHPLKAGRIREADIAMFATLMARVRYIGEVGLDRSPAGSPSWDRQVKVFERLLSLPGASRKLWSVHTRRAETVAIPMLVDAGVPAVLHWYTGSSSMLERALAAGLYFSVNRSMLNSSSGRRILGVLPKERVLTETDAPYVRSPRQNDPASDVQDVVAALGVRWDVSAAEAQRIIFANMSAAAAITSEPAGDCG